ncbi:MAG: SHOCT domain-containing protein [Halobacteriota archaeon]
MNDADRLLWLIMLLIVGLILAPMILMGMFMPAMGAHWSTGDGTTSIWWFGGWIVMLVVLLGIGYLLYRLAVGGVPAEDTAVEELRAAYARGDIDDEEYEKRYERLKEA